MERLRAWVMTELEGSIHEAELNWWNVVSWKVLSLNKVRVNKRVRRSGVHKGFEDHVREGIGSKQEYK